jgi:hypothetical protein
MEKTVTTAIRKTILRADAIFFIAGSAGFVADLIGAYFDPGALAVALVQAPIGAVGFVGAHGLAIVFGVLLWRAEPVRPWHLTAVAIHALLGASNLIVWPSFVAADRLAIGCITTTLHGILAALQLSAAHAAAAPAPRSA